MRVPPPLGKLFCRKISFGFEEYPPPPYRKNPQSSIFEGLPHLETDSVHRLSVLNNYNCIIPIIIHTSNIFNWIKKTSLLSIITKTTYQEHFLILERKCFVSPVLIPSSTQILLLLQDREPRSLSLKTTDFSSRPA